ncbi:hypothetical protein [Verrucosispora sp. WMMC514]|uniref:hypothetical protein n=1 Tax=Verrucosispora sp. WMMC514 TaxID=3015156 RepID=UPI00248BAFB9|nr:hypothetical protein [Verrucosispora sp. WMMC514]WBB94229.1 hypothetical protein O7597_15370 [Verrucosispora sp. WMMC514]
MTACHVWLARDFLIRHRIYDDLPPACAHPAEDCPPHHLPAEPAPPGGTPEPAIAA